MRPWPLSFGQKWVGKGPIIYTGIGILQVATIVVEHHLRHPKHPHVSTTGSCRPAHPGSRQFTVRRLTPRFRWEAPCRSLADRTMVPKHRARVPPPKPRRGARRVPWSIDTRLSSAPPLRHCTPHLATTIPTKKCFSPHCSRSRW